MILSKQSYINLCPAINRYISSSVSVFQYIVRYCKESVGVKHLYAYFPSGKHFSLVILFLHAHNSAYRAVEVVLNNNQCNITENWPLFHPVRLIIFFHAVA